MGCTISKECQKCGSVVSTTRNNLGLDLCCNCAQDYHRFKSQRQFYCKAKERLYPRTDLGAAMSLKRISSGRNWEGPSIRSPYQPSKHVEELYLQDDSQNQVHQWLNAQKHRLEERYYSIVNTASSSSSGAVAEVSTSQNNNTGYKMVTVEENALEISYSDNNIDDNISTSSKGSSGRHYCRAEIEEQHASQGPTVCRQVTA